MSVLVKGMGSVRSTLVASLAENDAVVCVPSISARTYGASWPSLRRRRSSTRSTSYCAAVIVPGARIACQRDASQAPLAAVAASSSSRPRSAADSVRRAITTSRAMFRAVDSSISATPCESSTVTSGSAWGAPVAASAPGRAGVPAATTRPAKTSAPARDPATATRRGARIARRGATRVEPRTTRRGRAAQTTKSALSTATFVANSVVNGAIRSVASSPTPTAYARRPARLSGIVRGSVIMKKRNTRISGDDTSVHQNSAPSIGPTCQAAVIVCPVTASSPIPAAKDNQKPTAIPVRCSLRRITKPPVTMTASASTSAGESGPHQNASGSARSGPRSRKQGTRPKFDGLKM